MIYIGVDPGLSGAVAFFRPSDNALHVYDMPLRGKRGGSGRNEIDNESLAGTFRRYCGLNTLAVVELVGARTYKTPDGGVRGQGAAASFTFGKSAGVVIGILAALRTPTIEVQPAVWKSLLNLSSDKIQSRTRASFLFPAQAARFIRLRDDGRAEAALMAYFAWKKFGGGK